MSHSSRVVGRVHRKGIGFFSEPRTVAVVPNIRLTWLCTDKTIGSMKTTEFPLPSSLRTGKKNGKDRYRRERRVATA